MKKFRETQEEGDKPTARYVDSAGRTRFKGLPGLKQTQTLSSEKLLTLDREHMLIHIYPYSFAAVFEIEIDLSRPFHR